MQMVPRQRTAWLDWAPRSHFPAAFAVPRAFDLRFPRLTPSNSKLTYSTASLGIPVSQLHCQKQKIQTHEEKRRVAEKVGKPPPIVSQCAILRVARIIADGKLRAEAAAKASLIWNPHLPAGSSGKAERSGSFRNTVTFPGNQAVRLDNRGLCQRRSRLRAPPYILHMAIIRENPVQSEEQKDDPWRPDQCLREPSLAVQRNLFTHKYKPMSRPQREQSRGIGYLVGRGAPQCGHRQNRKLTYTPPTAITMEGRKSHTVWRSISWFAGVLGCVSTRNNAQMMNKKPPPPIRSQM